MAETPFKPPIFTTFEDYQREVADLAKFEARLPLLEREIGVQENTLAALRAEFEAFRRDYDEKWRRLRQVTRNIRYWDNRLDILKKELASLQPYHSYLERSRNPSLSPVERYISGQTARRLKPRGYTEIHYQRLKGIIPIAEARRIYWTNEQTVVINQINALRDRYNYLRDNIEAVTSYIRQLRREYAGVQAAINKLKDEIPRKVIEQLIGDEACSGNTIFYTALRKEYVVRKPKHGEQLIGDLVRREKKLGLTYTASIETGEGHDVPLDVEITAVTLVKEMEKDDVLTVEREMDKAVIRHLMETNWDNLMPSFEKKGVEYNGEQHIRNIHLYPFRVPDYPTAHVLVERKSRYIPKRTYEADITLR